jgi:hypothetical protein
MLAAKGPAVNASPSVATGLVVAHRRSLPGCDKPGVVKQRVRGSRSGRGWIHLEFILIPVAVIAVLVAVLT